MPKITNLSVTYGRKVNLGDYNSANVEITIWADVEEGENLDEASRSLWEMAKNNVKAQYAHLVAKQDAKVKEIFLGLPEQLKNTVKGDK